MVENWIATINGGFVTCTDTHTHTHTRQYLQTDLYQTEWQTIGNQSRHTNTQTNGPTDNNN